MFVSRSKYEEKESQVRALEARVQDALDKIERLEAENSQLINTIETASNQSSSVADSTVVRCLIDALRQLEGVRETVLSSYERINAESQYIVNIQISSFKINWFINCTNNALCYTILYNFFI